MIHFLYTGVYLVIVSLFSNNLYLLGLNIVMLLLIVLSKLYYNECILNKIHNDKGFFNDINNYIKKVIGINDWNPIFFILFLVSAYRFRKLYLEKEINH